MINIYKCKYALCVETNYTFSVIGFFKIPKKDDDEMKVIKKIVSFAFFGIRFYIKIYNQNMNIERIIKKEEEFNKEF